MDEIVTLAPWSPWPLAIPIVLLVGAIAVSIVGTRLRMKPMREAGYVTFIVAAFGGVAIWWSLASMWDTGERQDALVELGYEGPTFSAGTDVVDGELPPIAWQAERDGERVRGVLLHQGGDQWIVRETRRG
ncbi:hypothetical protein FLP10_08085 [Agromyces intestinalis]|uniref:Uncharacterized protein n=1 Tax=Agromyces intestinalis TaxID=2592652 RepID=A0A5C1YHY3_9MICO|nr:hypothetical protein [Agromyces intestinalis]QEO14382.1 hypothetical protein FLP10_08085 [Agromyces intestinalis]